MSRLEPVTQRVAVDDDAVAVVSLHLECHFLAPVGLEHGLVASREVLEFHTGGEGGVSAIVEIDGTGMDGGGIRIAAHRDVVPILDFHS